jgi:hypothetical protein
MNGAKIRNGTGASRDEVVVRTIATITSVGACAVAFLAAGCGNPSSPSQDPTTTIPTTTTPPVQAEPPPAAETPEAAQAAQQWPMPDLVGLVLQDAQDQIQALTGGAVFFTDSHDLSGQDRNQVLDANWQVCTQNLAPGAAVTSASLIDVGVVKLSETCP